MFFEVLMALSVIVCIAFIVRNRGKDVGISIAGEIVALILILTVSLIPASIAILNATITDIEPIAEYQIDESSPVIHSANGRYYLKYNGTTTQITNPFIVDPSLSNKTSPTILVCEVKHSFWVPYLLAKYHNDNVKYVLVISSEQIVEEKIENKSEPIKIIPEWL